MSLQALAQELQGKGRGEDTILVHMTPGEVNSLQGLALQHQGQPLTINPETGLPEAGILSTLLPIVAGFALGPAGFGIASSALGAGAMVGGATALLTGDLKKGFMAGLGAYGGSSLGAKFDPFSQVAKNTAGSVAPEVTKQAAQQQAQRSLSTGLGGSTGQVGSLQANALAPQGFMPEAIQNASSTGMGTGFNQAINQAVPVPEAFGGALQGAGNLDTASWAGNTFNPGIGQSASIPLAANAAQSSPWYKNPWIVGGGLSAAALSGNNQGAPAPEQEEDDYEGPYMPVERTTQFQGTPEMLANTSEFDYFSPNALPLNQGGNAPPGYMPIPRGYSNGYASGGLTDLEGYGVGGFIKDVAYTGLLPAAVKAVGGHPAFKMGALGVAAKAIKDKKDSRNKDELSMEEKSQLEELLAARHKQTLDRRLGYASGGLTDLEGYASGGTSSMQANRRQRERLNDRRNSMPAGKRKQALAKQIRGLDSGFKTMRGNYRAETPPPAPKAVPDRLPDRLPVVQPNTPPPPQSPGGKGGKQIPPHMYNPGAPGMPVGQSAPPGYVPPRNSRVRASRPDIQLQQPQNNYGSAPITGLLPAVRASRPDIQLQQPQNNYGLKQFMPQQQTSQQQMPQQPLQMPMGYASGGGIGTVGLVELEDGSFIVDARTVSEIGNGSSDAGIELLGQLGGTPINGPGDGTSDSIPAVIEGTEEVRVARQEVMFPPEAVEALGGKEVLYALMDRATDARQNAEPGDDTAQQLGLGDLVGMEA